MSTRILFLFVGIFFSHTSYSQDAFLDSLRTCVISYKADSSFISYYKMVEEYEYQLEQAGCDDLIIAHEEDYNLLPGSRQDSAAYRKYLMYHAVKIKNVIGDYNHALHFYLKAHNHISDKHNLDKWAWHIEKLIGGIYARQNEFEKSIYFYKLTIPYLEKKKKYRLLARLYADIGDCYLWLGQIDKMHSSWRLGLDYAEKSQSHKAFQSIYSNLADYYINYKTSSSNLDSFDFFIKKAESSLMHLDNGRDFNLRQADIIELRADRFASLGKTLQAIELYKRQYQILKNVYKSNTSREIAKLHYKIATSYFMSNKLELCEIHIEKGISFLNSMSQTNISNLEDLIDQENTYTDLLNLRSQNFYQKYKNLKRKEFLDLAIMSVDLALHAHHQLDEKILLVGSRYASLKLNKKLICNGLEYCYEGFDKFNDQSYVDKARYYFDESKSKILNDIKIENRKKELLSKQDAILYDSLNFQLRRIQVIKNRTENLEMMMVDLSAQKESLLSKYIPRHDDFQEIGMDYLEYVASADSYFLFNNFSKRKFLKIDAKTRIDLLIDSIGKKIDRLDQSDFQILDELGNHLIPLDLNDNERLTIIPDGKISYLPFDLLRNNGAYLLETKIINRQPHRLCQREKPKANKEIEIFCIKPNYQRLVVDHDQSLNRGGLYHLPFAEEEVKNIQDQFSSVKVAFEPTREEIYQGLKENSFFHFAGHSMVKQDSAYLVLNDEGDKLTLQEMELMKNNLELVTLSSCESGLGIYKPGEGIRSLANSVFLSGARSIVFSLWNANDHSTSLLMKEFYKNLKQGQSKDVALRNSKLKFIEMHPEAAVRPFHWAAFVVSGDLGPIPNSNFNITYVMLLLGMVALAIYYKTKN